MTLYISDPEADVLAKHLAELDETSVADAVIRALKEAIATRAKRESPMETARRLLVKHGLSFPPDRKPVPPEVYHDLDGDLLGED